MLALPRISNYAMNRVREYLAVAMLAALFFGILRVLTWPTPRANPGPRPDQLVSRATYISVYSCAATAPYRTLIGFASPGYDAPAFRSFKQSTPPDSAFRSQGIGWNIAVSTEVRPDGRQVDLPYNPDTGQIGTGSHCLRAPAAFRQWVMALKRKAHADKPTSVRSNASSS